MHHSLSFLYLVVLDDKSSLSIAFITCGVVIAMAETRRKNICLKQALMKQQTVLHCTEVKA